MKMKTSVQDTRPVSQAHLDLSTAEIPRKMKMMVSAMLARVFIVYFTVVRDFWEMLASTYLLAPIPQKVILRREKEELHFYWTITHFIIGENNKNYHNNGIIVLL